MHPKMRSRANLCPRLRDSNDPAAPDERHVYKRRLQSRHGRRNRFPCMRIKDRPNRKTGARLALYRSWPAARSPSVYCQDVRKIERLQAQFLSLGRGRSSRRRALHYAPRSWLGRKSLETHRRFRVDTIRLVRSRQELEGDSCTRGIAWKGSRKRWRARSGGDQSTKPNLPNASRRRDCHMLRFTRLPRRLCAVSGKAQDRHAGPAPA